MKRLIIGLGIFYLSGILVLWLNVDPGYVIIGRGMWSIETSVPVFLLLFCLSFILLYFFSHLLTWLWHLPQQQQQKHRQHLQRLQQHNLQTGLEWLLSENWAQAQRILLKNKPNLLHYLAAAYAAQQQGLEGQRDDYLENAYALAHKSERELLQWFQLRLRLAQGQDSFALVHLQSLYQNHLGHPLLLNWLAQIYQRQQDWDALWQLFPALRKYKALTNKALNQLEQLCALQRLEHITKQKESSKAVYKLWKSLSKTLRLQAKLSRWYVQFLQQQGQYQQAEAVLRHSLEKYWHIDNLYLYSELEGDTKMQLNHAELWLKQHDDKPELLIALGQLAVRNQLWHKAQDYFETSLKQQSSILAWQNLAELYTRMGEHNKAASCFKQALVLKTAQNS